MTTRHPLVQLAIIVIGGLIALTTALVVLAPVNRAAAASTTPAAITDVTSRPGPLAGQLTISWTSTGAGTARYRIETGLNMFSKTDPAMRRSGRNAHAFSVPASRRSITLSRAQLTAAGAPLGSANHLYFRVFAVGRKQPGVATSIRAYPYLQAGQVAARAAQGQVPVRIGSYNVRTIVKSDTGNRAWTKRAPYVAKTIMSRLPGLVALQELSPGTVDGTATSPRQTESLMSALRRAGGSRYAMVRTTSYFPGGTVTGSQGTRIVYDRTRYTLVSRCSDTTVVDGRTKGYSRSCTFDLPLRAHDSEAFRRHVAYAQFEDKATGTRFWFVSAHLEHRTSTVAAERDSLEALRGRQVDTITATMDRLNTARLPIIVGGDLNTWQNTASTYAPHNEMIEHGYYDTAAAISRINLQYATMNDFQTTMKPTALNFGARLDAIMVKGTVGASRFENVMNRTEAVRGSDHNMIVADFRLPRN